MLTTSSHVSYVYIKASQKSHVCESFLLYHMLSKSTDANSVLEKIY